MAPALCGAGLHGRSASWVGALEQLIDCPLRRFSHGSRNAPATGRARLASRTAARRSQGSRSRCDACSPNGREKVPPKPANERPAFMTARPVSAMNLQTSATSWVTPGRQARSAPRHEARRRRRLESGRGDGIADGAQIAARRRSSRALPTPASPASALHGGRNPGRTKPSKPSGARNSRIRRSGPA
jgi:hypothetical protein